MNTRDVCVRVRNTGILRMREIDKFCVKCGQKLGTLRYGAQAFASGRLELWSRTQTHCICGKIWWFIPADIKASDLADEQPVEKAKRHYVKRSD